MKLTNYFPSTTSAINNTLALIALSLILPLHLSAQSTGSISGRVSDANNQSSLSGVAVRVEGTAIAASTDNSGRYVLINVPSGAQEISFSYIGYDSVTRSANVSSGVRTNLNTVMGEEVLSLEEFTVEGQVEGSAKAINAQRASDNLKNIIAADAIGNFPDQNISESLARLPGLSVRRDQGEGRAIIIRGADPNLNSVTINGTSIPTPDDERREVSLDVIPSDILGRLVVTKAVTADMDADSIGGSVEATTASAFDREGRWVGGRIEGSYNKLTEEWSPRIGFIYSDIFSVGNGENNLGTVFAISWYDRAFASLGLEGDEFAVIDEGDYEDEGLTVPDAVDQSALFPEKIEYRDYTVNRERLGMAFNIDYRPNDLSKYYVHGLISKFEDTEVRQRTRLRYDKGFASSLTDREGSFDDIEIVKDIKDRVQDQILMSFTVGGENEVGNWIFDYSGSYSFADEEEVGTNNPEFENSEDFNSSYVLSNAGIPSVIAITESDLNDPNNFEFNETETAENLTEDEEFAFKFNATYNTELGGHPGYLKFGGKARFRNKSVANEVQIWGWEGDDDLSMAQFAGGDVLFSQVFANGATVNTQAWRNFFNSNIGPDGFEADPVDSLVDSLLDDYAIEEDVYSGYFMGRVDVDKLRIVAGVRVEHTKVSSQGNQVDVVALEDDIDDGGNGLVGVTVINFDKDYTHVLPSFHVRYAANDNLIYRFAYTKTVSRPTFGAQAPRNEVEDEDVVAGNPTLKPLESNNLDFTVEYYMQSLGQVTAGVFYKNIDNFIATSTFSGEFAGVDGEADISQSLNGESATLWGLEFSWQQRLSFLPSPLDGLLISANYTIVDSESIIDFGGDRGRQTLPLFRQSDNVANFTIGYEKYGISLRLSASYRDQYLDDYIFNDDSPNTDLDLWASDHIQWDFTAAYRLNQNIKLYMEISNLGDEPFQTHYGKDTAFRNAQYEQYRLTANFGVKWNL